jgi:nucleoside-diphosphate-sugar epimerase
VNKVRFTVFGSSGFIGRSVSEYLLKQGYEVITPKRDEIPPDNFNLGHVIFAIGANAGIPGNKIQDTIEANITALVDRISNSTFTSWLYLSSTRIYGFSDIPSSEQDIIHMTPGSENIYGISKLLGESICLSLTNPNIRIARLSNVYGRNQSKYTFLGSIKENIANSKHVTIFDHKESSKDYIAIDDVTSLIEKISLHGKQRLYNVASGKNIKHESIINCLSPNSNVNFDFNVDAIKRNYSPVNISRIVQEFNFKPRYLLDDIHIVFNYNLF